MSTCSGPGAPRGLYRDPAGFRDLFGGRSHFLRETAVRLYLHGLGSGGHHGSVLFRLGASFFHHGGRPNVNLFFGIATMLIGIPTGVKIYNWLFTMYRGRVRFTTPMYWTLGFIVTFVIGGAPASCCPYRPLITCSTTACF